MKKLVYHIALAVLFLTPGYALSQNGSVAGKIYGQDSALALATIELRPSGKSDLSDEKGQFKFSSVTPGKYQLVVSMTGYETVIQGITVTAGKTTNTEIELNGSVSLLNPVVITGTMKAVQKSESPVNVEVYTPQFFKKNPAPSIFESLQNVNGVRPQINCSVCNTGDIHINGLEGPYTMITIDGMPIVSSLASVYGLFGIPTQLIERVEIVKGPASGLYGAEAIGGLINIITKAPDKAPVFTANLMTTSWQEHVVDLGTKFRLGKKTISLTGINYFNYQKPFDRNNDLFTDITLQHRISVFNKISFIRNQKRVASLAGRFFTENRWGGEMNWKKNFRGTDSIYGESISTTRWELIGNYQLPVKEKLFFAFSATGHKQDSYYGTTPYKANQTIFFNQFTWDKTSGVHDLLTGAALRYNYYDDNSTATIDTLTKINSPEKYVIPGIFVQDEIRLNAKQKLLLGFRYDYHAEHKNIFTPRIAYKWTLKDKQVLRLNAGTGFRVVSLFTEDHAALTGARVVEIKEKLKPEKSYNINLNYTYYRKLGSHSLNFDLSTWNSWFTNQIIADYDTDPGKIIYNNLRGHVISKGVSLNMEWNAGNRLKALAGITVQDVAKFEKDGAGKKIKQQPVLTERFSGTWSVSYHFPQAGISIDYTGNIYGPMRLPLVSKLDPRPEYSPVWSLQNIQFTKRINKEFEFYTGIKNILNWTPAKKVPFIIARTNDPFDKKVQYNQDGTILSTPDNPYALSFDPAYVFAPNQGIRVFAGLRVHIK